MVMRSCLVPSMGYTNLVILTDNRLADNDMPQEGKGSKCLSCGKASTLTWMRRPQGQALIAGKGGPPRNNWGGFFPLAQLTVLYFKSTSGVPQMSIYGSNYECRLGVASAHPNHPGMEMRSMYRTLRVNLLVFSNKNETS
jgi:hypothetical protein